MPGQHSYLWQPGSVSLHVSDLLIALTNYLILIILIYFVRKRRNVLSPAQNELEKIAALTTDISQALTNSDNLPRVLQQCTEALVQHLDLAFARIWTLDETEDVLELQASAGLYTHLDGPHGRVAVGQLKIGRIAQTRQPHLTNAVVGDPYVNNQEWAKQEGMIAFAGYPLLVEDKVVGVMAMFARKPLTTQTLNQLSTIADPIAQYIQRKRTETALAESQRRLTALIDSLPGIVFSTGNNSGWSMKYLSEGCFNLTGYKSEELVGNGAFSYLSIVYAEDLPRVFRAINTAIAVAQPYVIEYRIHTKSRQEKWLWEKGSAVLDELGSVLGIEGFITDITELKQSEAALRKSEAKNQALVNAIPDLMIRMRRDGTYLDFRPAKYFKTIMPWTSMMGKNLYEVMPREIARQRMEYVEQALETGQTQVYEYQIALDDQLCYEEARVVVSGEDEVLTIIRDVTERKQTEAALQQAKEKYRSIFENAVEGIFQVTLDGRYISANPALARIYGHASSEELLASLTDANQHLYVHAERYVEFIQLMQQNKTIERFESQIYRQDGSIIWISQNARPIVHADRIEYYEGFVEDITERKQAEVALQQSEQRFRAIFENVAIGIGLTDSEGRHVEVNPAWQKILGYSNEELSRMSFTEFTYPDDVAADVELYKELLAGRRDHYQMEKRYICKSGQLAWGRLTVSLIRGSSNETQLAIATIENITERKRVEDKLQHNVLHDVLTNLPNRALFLQRLETALEPTQRSAGGSSGGALPQAQRQAGYLFAVLFLDLDRFKNINDSLGHLVGDRLLIAIAQKLAAILRPGDTVARLGGDEFAILLEDIKHVSDATRIAERIQQQLSLPLNLDGHEVFTTVSIGIALSTHGYSNAEEILRDADTAMYRAKGLGKARYEIFNKAMHERVFTVL